MSTRARALEHEHESSRARARERMRARAREYESTRTSTRARSPLEYENEHESTRHEATRQSVRAVRMTACETCRTFFHPCGFACAWVALRDRNASPWLLASFSGFEPPEHVPRTSARAHSCAVVYGRLLRAPEPRAQEKTRGRKRNKYR